MTQSQTDLPTQVPQDITLGLLWPNLHTKYTERNNKYKGKVPVNNNNNNK